jgi:hypothetical protein
MAEVTKYKNPFCFDIHSISFPRCSAAFLCGKSVFLLCTACFKRVYHAGWCHALLLCSGTVWQECFSPVHSVLQAGVPCWLVPCIAPVQWPCVAMQCFSCAQWASRGSTRPDGTRMYNVCPSIPCSRLVCSWYPGVHPVTFPSM